jgi:hypothetical protein
MEMYQVDEQVWDEEQIVDEFMEGNTRARELRMMRAALEHRHEMVQRDLDRAKTDAEQVTLRSKLRELTRQIAALKQEETISEFVETSVKVTLYSNPPED